MKSEGERSDSKRQYDPIIKGAPSTMAENFLGQLCKKSFLSLWSYPGVFRNQGESSKTGDGKEICDLLVVFGDHVIIFSDKDCRFQTDVGLELGWGRWFKNAIAKSALQAWGGKRWIESFPNRVFLDRKCKQPFPLNFPKVATFHLIVVAHGISEHVATKFGGSGSLLINSKLRGIANHTEPFFLGDLDPDKPFVHIFDEYSLNTVMTTLNTVVDFIRYLDKREYLLRGPIAVISPGEEELLAIYLQSINSSYEHDFVFPKNASVTGLQIGEGEWERFQNHPQRIAQIESDRISYSWDALIEKFSFYALQGRQHYVTDGGLKDSEKILRFMASEPRLMRRILSTGLLELLRKTPKGVRGLRLGMPPEPGRPCYVFLIFPRKEDISANEKMSKEVIDAEYRNVRFEFLIRACLVARYLHPHLEDIVGIATESGIDGDRSEDSAYLDGRNWTPAMEEEAKWAQTNLQLFEHQNEIRVNEFEFPQIEHSGGQSSNLTAYRKVGRNESCPCGSQKKFKKCCLK